MGCSTAPSRSTKTLKYPKRRRTTLPDLGGGRAPRSGGEASRSRDQRVVGLLFLPCPDRPVAPLRGCERRHDFLSPMFAFAAHTARAARRCCASASTNIDFGGKTPLTEAKRGKGNAPSGGPLSPVAGAILRGWVAKHPGGQYSSAPPRGPRSRKRRTAFGPLTRNEANTTSRGPSRQQWRCCGAGTSSGTASEQLRRQGDRPADDRRVARPPDGGDAQALPPLSPASRDSDRASVWRGE